MVSAGPGSLSPDPYLFLLALSVDQVYTKATHNHLLKEVGMD